MRRIGGLLLASMLMAGTAAAQDPASQPNQKLIDRAQKAIDERRYLEPDLLLHQAAFNPDGTIRDEDAYGSWEQTHAAVSDWLPPPVPPGDNGLDAASLARLEHADLSDAIGEIVRRARNTRIVILNEDHSDSRDRAFGLEVARALRPLGYDIIAMETLSPSTEEAGTANAMERLAERGAPIRGDGYYTRDPVFADFLRQSLSIGYRPVAYEATRYDFKQSPAAQVASRERQQAENLYRRALRNRPNAKLFVYVGLGHVAEYPVHPSSGGTQLWMAARLKALSGIDPLTIDQVAVRFPDPPKGGDDELTRRLGPRLGTRSMVAMRRGKPLVVGRYEGWVDLQVIHPPARVVDGRPDWLFAMNRKPISVPISLLPKKGDRLVQAFAAADDPARAIPVDQFVVSAGAPPPPLLVPSGMTIRFGYEDPPESMDVTSAK